MYNPGVLNKVATLQRLNPNKKTKNGFRDNAESWEDIKTFRCKILTEESKSIRSAFKYGAIVNLDYKIVECRFFEDIKHSDRLIINKKPYEIEVINNVEEANQWYRLWVKGVNT